MTHEELWEKTFLAAITGVSAGTFCGGSWGVSAREVADRAAEIADAAVEEIELRRQQEQQ